MVAPRPDVLVGLPLRTAGIGLVVSRAVAQAAPERTDLLVPLDVVRDVVGNVLRAGRWPGCYRRKGEA